MISLSVNFVNKTVNYDRVSYFDRISGMSYMCLSNEQYIPRLLAIPRYRALINNKKLASSLPDVTIDRSKFYNMCDPTTAFRSLLPVGTEEIPDVVAGQSLLRVNEKRNVVYTVSKAGSEYVFTAFHINYDEQLHDIRTCLLSRWKVNKIPDISFFKNIRPNVTTVDEVRANDTNFSLYEDEGIYVSHHVFSDELGSVAWVKYKKHEDGKIYVDKIEWESSGYNILPYLLPIDRQLIDPSYVPPADENPGCSIM